MKKISLILATVCLAALIWAYMILKPTSPKTYTLRFEAMSGDAPFVFGEFVHDDPIGGEPFQLRDLRFYVSNVRLSDGERVYDVPESYYLVRFDARSNMYEVVLPDVPLSEIKQLSFTVGLDPEANKTIAPLGDVDPNSRMAWNWEIGYKFLLAEGELQTTTGLVPLVYHVGFDENARRVDLELAELSTEIPIIVDVMKLFDSETTFDLSELSSIKMDRTKAQMMAGSFRKMFTFVED